MFQAAQIALTAAGFGHEEWTHSGLHGAFAAQLIHRRKLYPSVFRDYLSSALFVRQAADLFAFRRERKDRAAIGAPCGLVSLRRRKGGSSWNHALIETSGAR
jgi:hypothetical protein